MEAQVQEAQAYLTRHQIPETFQALASVAAHKRPDDLKAFLIENLEAIQKFRKGEGDKFPVQAFTEQDVKAFFRTVDAAKRGAVTGQQLSQSIQTLTGKSASSLLKAVPSADASVTESQFVQAVTEALGKSVQYTD